MQIMHKSSFNIRTAHDFLHEMIIPQHENFREKNSSSRHALLTIILIYHMYEWVHGSKFSINHFRSTYKNEDGVAEMFELARNIANGTKHFLQKVKTHVQPGFSSGFSDGFARPLNVECDDGRKQSADVFLRQLVEFWVQEEKDGAF